MTLYCSHESVICRGRGSLLLLGCGAKPVMGVTWLLFLCVCCIWPCFFFSGRYYCCGGKGVNALGTNNSACARRGESDWECGVVLCTTLTNAVKAIFVPALYHLLRCLIALFWHRIFCRRLMAHWLRCAISRAIASHSQLSATFK